MDRYKGYTPNLKEIRSSDKLPTRRRFIKLISGAAAAIALRSSGFKPVSASQQTPDENSKHVSEKLVPPIPEFVRPNPEQKVIIIPIKDETTDIVTSKERLEAMIKEVDNYYQENSYGKIRYLPQVLDWYSSEEPIDPEDLDTIAQLGNSLVDKAGIQSQPHTTRIYYIDRRGKEFHHGGQGQKAEPFNKVWINADEFDYTHQRAMIHELGHTLSLDHSDFAYNALQNNFTQHVRIDSAGSTQDIMGGGDGHFNGPHKVSLGWIEKDQIETVTQEGEYEIDPLELATNGVQLLRIQKPDTSEFYYLENRQSIGADKRGMHGLRFNIWNEHIDSPTKEVYVAHMHPEVVDGDVFFDSSNGIKVKQISSEGGKIKVSVAFVEKNPQPGIDKQI